MTELGAAEPLSPAAEESAVLRIEDLRTQFLAHGGIARAVDGVSYHVNRGETLGVVGESGCGKSVTALSVMRLVPDPPGRIVGGRVLLHGRDLLELDEPAMRRVRGNQIGMIFQEPMTSLNPVLTVGRQIEEVVELHQNLQLGRRRSGQSRCCVWCTSPSRSDACGNTRTSSAAACGSA